MMLFFFFKQKTAYEMRISDWSSDVCSSDLRERGIADEEVAQNIAGALDRVIAVVGHRQLLAVEPARVGDQPHAAQLQLSLHGRKVESVPRRLLNRRAAHILVGGRV